MDRKNGSKIAERERERATKKRRVANDGMAGRQASRQTARIILCVHV